MLLQEIDIHRFLGIDGFGKETFEPAFTARVRLQETGEMIVDFHGKEQKSHAIIYHYTAGLLSEKDKVTTPDGMTRHVLKTKTSPSLRGRKTLHKAWMV